MKRDLTKILYDEIYSTPAKRNVSTIKIKYTQIDEIYAND